MNANSLQQGLCTKRFGKRIVFLREVGSTNNAAKELAASGAAEGTIVIAESQTAGRGRLSREWESPRGGLYFSVVLRPELNARKATKLVFMLGLAVARTLHESYGLKVETKWPNDVLVGGRKICGILSEAQISGDRTKWVIAGVGINANVSAKDFSDELRETATSLKRELGKAVRLEELFARLVEHIEKEHDFFLQNGFARVLEEWKKHAVFLGQSVEVETGSESLRGQAVDVDQEGALILKLQNGMLKRVFVGDVTAQTRFADM